MERSQLVKNLCFLMEKRMETPNAVAVSCGLKASTLMRLLDGSSTAPRNSTLQALAMHFGVNPGALLKVDLSAHVEEPVEHKNVSEPISLLTEEDVLYLYLVNEADTATENTFSYRRLSGERTWLPAPPDQELIDLIKEKSDDLLPPIFAFKVQSDAMAPTFRNGDIVYVRYTYTESIFNPEGQLVGFTIPDEIKSGDFVLGYGSTKDQKPKDVFCNVVVRQFCLDDVGGNDFLLSTNPNWPGERALICERLVGKIVGHYRKY